MDVSERPAAARVRTLQLNDSGLEILKAALDSHEYWQLSDPVDRNSDYVILDDPALSEEMAECRALLRKLESLS